jgi:trans-aconitate 2-methyltransferase
MSDWKPKQYLMFADERARPVVDLLARIPLARPRLVFDLGCGPGNSTALLRQHYPEARIAGIDKSPAMIAKAKELTINVEFSVADVALWRADRAADLVFSNALFQWLPDHPQLMQKIVKDMKSGAVLAVQMPDNLDEPTHTTMREVAGDKRWHGKLQNAARSRLKLPEPHQYAELLRPFASEVEIWRTTYFHRVNGTKGISDFFRSTGLRPFLEPLSPQERETFVSEYVNQLTNHYPASADGTVLFGLPRLFIMARN